MLKSVHNDDKNKFTAIIIIIEIIVSIIEKLNPFKYAIAIRDVETINVDKVVIMKLDRVKHKKYLEVDIFLHKIRSQVLLSSSLGIVFEDKEIVSMADSNETRPKAIIRRSSKLSMGAPFKVIVALEINNVIIIEHKIEVI